MYNLEIIDKRNREDGPHVILLRLTKGQILPAIKGFEKLRKGLEEEDYRREDYKYYYRRIDCPTSAS